MKVCGSAYSERRLTWRFSWYNASKRPCEYWMYIAKCQLLNSANLNDWHIFREPFTERKCTRSENSHRRRKPTIVTFRSSLLPENTRWKNVFDFTDYYANKTNRNQYRPKHVSLMKLRVISKIEAGKVHDTSSKHLRSSHVAKQRLITSKDHWKLDINMSNPRTNRFSGLIILQTTFRLVAFVCKSYKVTLGIFLCNTKKKK